MQRDLDGFADGTAVNRGADTSAASPPSAPPPPPPPGGWGPAPWAGGAGWAPRGWGGEPGWSPPPGPRQPGGRRRGLFIAAAVFGALVIAAASATAMALFVRGGGPVSAPPSPQTSPSPRPAVTRALTAYHQMLAAANASAGCHYVAVSTISGAPITKETITGDAGRSDGTQTITLASTYGAEQFTLRLSSDGSVYFEGNTPALEDQIGVVPSSAPALDGKWVLVAKQDGPYDQLEQGITVESHLNGDTLLPTSVTTVSTASGSVERISGTGDGGVPAHFDAASGSKLPQAYAEGSAGAGITATETLTRWGTAPSVSVPSGAVPWSSLPTAQPPGGYGSGGSNQGGTGGSSPAPTPTPSGGSV